eukprot:3655766-Alexandrium_andersonii.AAC.1
MQCGWTIAAAKALENTAWALALFVLRHWQLDQKVLDALEAAWKAQCRWPAFGGAVAADGVRDVLGLPQGDPFSPLALSA